MMAVSQNGWLAVTDSKLLHTMPWITGRMLPGDVWTIFDHLFRRFNAEVETIVPSHSWGWNYRPISDSLVLSNHASATAGDVNAPTHPRFKLNTFSPAQVKAIEVILAFFEGVIRWGGHYSAERRDDMHFEIDVPPTDPRVKKLADRIRLMSVAPVPTPGPPPLLPVGLAGEQMGQLLAAIAAIPQATAHYPINYSSGAVRWIQDQADEHYRVKAVLQDTAALRAELASLRTDMPAMTQQALRDALAATPIVTAITPTITTTIGGQK